MHFPDISKYASTGFSHTGSKRPLTSVQTEAGNAKYHSYVFISPSLYNSTGFTILVLTYKIALPGWCAWEVHPPKYVHLWTVMLFLALFFYKQIRCQELSKSHMKIVYQKIVILLGEVLVLHT